LGKSDVGHYGGETFVIISYNAGERIKGMSYLVAASLAGILTTGVWLYMKHRSLDKTNTPTPIASNLKNDVAPGGNKATLTLANGQQILLDDAKAGMLTEQGTTQVIKKNAAPSATLLYYRKNRKKKNSVTIR